MFSEGSGREYQPAPYHGRFDSSVKSRAPTNGQYVLDSSVQVKKTSPRRVGVDESTGELVVFDKTYEGGVMGTSEAGAILRHR